MFLIERPVLNHRSVTLQRWDSSQKANKEVYHFLQTLRQEEATQYNVRNDEAMFYHRAAIQSGLFFVVYKRSAFESLQLYK